MQELEIARFRAIESRLPLIHCSNTGISGVFDPYGRFQPVNIHYFGEGRMRAFPADRFPIGAGRSQRMAGILPLPEKAPGGMAPWGLLAAVFLAALSLSALWCRIRPVRTGGDTP